MHDQHGNPIDVGDLVSVGFTIEETYPGAETCNVRLRRDIAGEPGGALILTCTASQVEKVSASTLAAEDAMKDTTDAWAGADAVQTVPDMVGEEGDPNAPPEPVEPEVLPRCDCSALPVPHVHAQGGPEPLESDDAVK